MFLAVDKIETRTSTNQNPIPPHWLKYKAPWSVPIYREYEFGSILIQELITQEFSIYIWTLEITEAVILYPVAQTPTIALQFMVEGDIDCILSGFGSKVLKKGSYEMFYVPMGFQEARFEPGFFETIHIEIKPVFLKKLLSLRREMRELQQRMKQASPNGLPMALAFMNYRTAGILRNMRNCEKKEASLQLEMHKFILELFSEYFSEIIRIEEDHDRRIVNHKKQITEVNNYILLEPNIHEHTLTKLAQRFNLSESILKKEFKILYNQTVSGFVRFHALQKGHDLLTDTTRTIEDIADEIGYSWRPAFEEAFKKQFNCTPAQVRNRLNS